MSYPGERAGIRLEVSGLEDIKATIAALSAKQIVASAKTATNAACRPMAAALKRIMQGISKSLNRERMRASVRNFLYGGASRIERIRKRTGDSIRAIRVGTPRGHRNRIDRAGSVVYFAGRVPGWYGRLLSSGWNHVAWGVRTGKRIPGTGAVEKAFQLSSSNASRIMEHRFVDSIRKKAARKLARGVG